MYVCVCGACRKRQKLKAQNVCERIAGKVNVKMDGKKRALEKNLCEISAELCFICNYPLFPSSYLYVLLYVQNVCVVYGDNICYNTNTTYKISSSGNNNNKSKWEYYT